MRSDSVTSTQAGIIAMLGGLVVAVALAVSLAAMPVGATDDPLDVEIDFPEEFAATDDQTVGVEVTEIAGDRLESGIVEVPVRNGFELADGAADDVTVAYEDGGERVEEDRTAFIDDSTFRDGAALFVELDEIEPEQTRTYAVNIDVTDPGTVTVEAEVEPLYNPDIRVRGTGTGDAAGTGTIDGTVAGDDEATIEVAGEELDATGSLSADVIEGSYDVTADIGLIELTVDDVSVDPFQTTSVSFSTYDAAPDPAVVADLGSGASVAGTTDRVMTEATAEQPRKSELTFDVLDVADRTYVGVDGAERFGPAQGVELVDAGATELEHDTADATVLVVDSDDSDDLTIEYDGYRLGDITLDGEVTANDADTIATAIAMGDTDDLNQYGDVTDDGELSPADAMFIQQYVDENRTAEYEEVSDS